MMIKSEVEIVTHKYESSIHEIVQKKQLELLQFMADENLMPKDVFLGILESMNIVQGEVVKSQIGSD